MGKIVENKSLSNVTRNLVLLALVITLVAGLSSLSLAADEAFKLDEDDGYRGIWYAVDKTGNAYGYKYSGGMATYPQQHVPIAIYAAAANKTFFVYGGTQRGKQRLLHMVSYFDHATKTVPRPRILLDKKTGDAHDNPTLAIDAKGYLWIFSNSHGTSRPSFIHRSAEPYSIESFVPVMKTNFSYSQPWVLDDGNFLLMHTHYKSGRGLFWMTSPDGFKWSEPESLAHLAQGHYQVTWSDGRRVATAFNYHPEQGGLNARTNLYYLETPDSGRTWRNAAGELIQTPLADVQSAAMVHDYQKEKLLVYLKQVQFDSQGRPVITYLTSRGHAPGPENDPRIWRISRWTGQRWETNDVTTSDHNYDYGPLDLSDDAQWRLIAPTEPGAQPYCTGGQMILWVSPDQGHSWRKEKPLTHDLKRNHSYARRPLQAHPDFAALWADGDARQPSESSLYFTDRAGTHVWRLPTTMRGSMQSAEIAW